MLAWLVMFVGFMAFLISLLGWTGVLIVSIVLALTAAWVSVVIVTTERRIRRRMRQLEGTTRAGASPAPSLPRGKRTHCVLPANGGSSQSASPSRTALPALSYRAPGKNHALTRLLELPWSQIADVRQATTSATFAAGRSPGCGSPW